MSQGLEAAVGAMAVETIERDGMRILVDVPFPASDGTTLRADVFLPAAEGRYPTILSYGCYAKGQSFQEAYAGQWDRMVEDFPAILTMSSNRYQCWELTDPELWVRDGYAVVRVDSRGSGSSEGVQDVFSFREVLDYYDSIEWAAVQPWSSGRVGLLGISYYAVNQWMVAALQPPHLAAMIPWEGAADSYRDMYYHGGIRCQFLDAWLPRQLAMQHGYGDRGRKSVVTGRNVAGAVTLSDAELAANRTDKVALVKAHSTADDYYNGIIADWSKITIPFLSAGNWGGAGLHLRGNVEGFTQAASTQKWLEIHGMEHWTHFYTPYGVGLQKRFFDHVLKGEANGWDRQKPVILQVRTVDGFVERHEEAWPLPGTAWTEHYLDCGSFFMSQNKPSVAAARTFEASGPGLTFETAAMAADTEITGPLAATLYVSSDTSDVDLFAILRLFDPDGREVVFRGAMDAHAPVAQGWLRGSHRRLDPDKSLPYRPYHTHTDPEPLTPHEVYRMDVEIWPTSIVVPKGYRLALTIKGSDYVYSGPASPAAGCHRYPSRGCGPFLHNDPDNRPASVFAGRTTIHSGGSRASKLLLPVIPSSRARSP
ncbi:CocE/NonD family hydrolase [Microbacteriaceae bacterium K1510]|nr:CocE/NonD family hydrolase [Microbacteriaceae bacterium K1510]